MELYEEDYYIVELLDDKSPISTLFSLYQPLIGYEAAALYTTLWTEASINNEPLKHERLCRLLKMPVEKLESARIKLEQFGLLTSYYHKDKEQYLYRMHAPLSPNKFFSHYLYALLYKNALGLQEFERSKIKYEKTRKSVAGYKDVSVKLDKNILSSITETDMKEFIDIRSEEVFDENFGFSTTFDYENFIKGLTNLTFPLSLRTNENMRFIGRLATMSGMNPDALRIIVCNCIDTKKNILDQNKLMKKVLSDMNNKVDEVATGYNMAPLHFLQSKQPGIALSENSMNALKYLSATPFSPVVINILLEYVLQQTDNQLPLKYIKQTSEMFARDHVTNEIEAKQWVKAKKKEDKSKKQAFKKMITPVAVQEEQIDQKELEEVRKRYKEWTEGDKS